MRYHKQAFLHDPQQGVFGDCYRTVLACLLDLERDEVPHWVTTMDTEAWDAEVQPKYDTWLSERGLQELAIPFACDLAEVLAFQKTRLNDYPCMLTGTSKTGVNHVVIVDGGRITHDTSLTNAGIISPASDGFYWLTWLIPARHPAAQQAAA